MLLLRELISNPPPLVFFIDFPHEQTISCMGKLAQQREGERKSESERELTAGPWDSSKTKVIYFIDGHFITGVWFG